MDRKTKGRLGELKVLTYLTEQGYELYAPFADNSKFDVIAYKDGILSRVSVKFTSEKTPAGNWSVTIKQVSRRNNGDVKVDKFDHSAYDLLAVYISPEDRVVLIPTNSFTATTALTVTALEGDLEV